MAKKLKTKMVETLRAAWKVIPAYVSEGCTSTQQDQVSEIPRGELTPRTGMINQQPFRKPCNSHRQPAITQHSNAHFSLPLPPRSPPAPTTPSTAQIQTH